MGVPVFKIQVKSGRIEWTNTLRDLFRNHLFNLGDGEREMYVRKPGKPTSDPQRKYYWGCMIQIIADETGCHPLEIHVFCKENLLPFDKDSTEQLTTAEREEYHTKIRAHFAQEFGITIPLPNEYEQ